MCINFFSLDTACSVTAQAHEEVHFTVRVDLAEDDDDDDDDDSSSGRRRPRGRVARAQSAAGPAPPSRDTTQRSALTELPNNAARLPDVGPSMASTSTPVRAPTAPEQTVW